MKTTKLLQQMGLTPNADWKEIKEQIKENPDGKAKDLKEKD